MESDLEQRGGGASDFLTGSSEGAVSHQERRELLEKVEQVVSRDSAGLADEFPALEERIKVTLRNLFGNPELGFEMAEERLYPGYLVAFYLPNGQVFAGVNDVREKAFLIAAQEALRADVNAGSSREY